MEVSPYFGLPLIGFAVIYSLLLPRVYLQERESRQRRMEALTADIEEFQRALEEIWTRLTVREDGMNPAATHKARQLLRSIIGEEQMAHLDKNGWIEVTGSDGGAYRLWRSRSNSIYRSDLQEHLCIVSDARFYLPLDDNLVAQILLLQADEGRFRKIAYKW